MVTKANASKLHHPSQANVSSSPHICAGTRKQTQALDHFSQILLSHLDGFGVRYCVFSALQEAPDAQTTVQELAVYPKDFAKLLNVLHSLEDNDYFVVQEQIIVIPGVRRYCFACLRTPLPTFHELTILLGSSVNRFLPATEEIVERRWKREATWTASAADEFRYQLFKHCLPGRMSGTDEQRLQQLIHELGPEEAMRVTQDVFGNSWQSAAGKECVSPSAAQLLNAARKELWWKYLCRDPLLLFEYAVKALCGASGRWFRPNGLVVAILGPDGVGKSSFSAKLLEMFRPLFSNGRVLQWRPQIIKPRPEKNPLVFEPPHSRPRHGKVESVLRLLAVLVDYWVGEMLLIKPLLAKSSLLVYDRNFHDILVDTKRYRYGGPRWLLHLVKRMVPHNEVVFLTLEADPEIILQRKQEVSPEEVRRQCAEYRTLAQELPDSHVIRTDRDFEQSLAEGSRILVRYLNRRFKKRNGQSLPLVESPKREGEARVDLSRSNASIKRDSFPGQRKYV